MRNEIQKETYRIYHIEYRDRKRKELGKEKRKILTPEKRKIFTPEQRKIFTPEQRKDWRRNYNKEHIQERYEYKKQENIKKRKFILNYKKDKCCSQCGYKEHTEILQFHHQRDKSFTIAETKSIKQFKEEIKKCVLLCPNCHFYLHSKKI